MGYSSSTRVTVNQLLEQYPIAETNYGSWENWTAATVESQERQDLVEEGQGRRYYTPSGEQIPWSQAMELLSDPAERIVGRTPFPSALVSTVFTCVDIRSRDDIDHPTPLIYETVLMEAGEDGAIDVTVIGFDDTSAAAQQRHLRAVTDRLQLELETSDERDQRDARTS